MKKLYKKSNSNNHYSIESYICDCYVFCYCGSIDTYNTDPDGFDRFFESASQWK